MSKHSLLRLFVMLCFVMAASAVMAAAPDRFVIDKGWSFRLAPGNAQLAAHPEAAAWQAAAVPGTVHSDLFANELIPDPYVGAPEAGLQWIGLADWEYRTRFDAPRNASGAARSETTAGLPASVACAFSLPEYLGRVTTTLPPSAASSVASLR